MWKVRPINWDLIMHSRIFVLGVVGGQSYVRVTERSCNSDIIPRNIQKSNSKNDKNGLQATPSIPYT
jgi:hypothetical protein